MNKSGVIDRLAHAFGVDEQTISQNKNEQKSRSDFLGNIAKQWGVDGEGASHEETTKND